VGDSSFAEGGTDCAHARRWAFGWEVLADGIGYEDLPLPFKLISLKPTIIPNPSSLTFQSRVSDHNTSQEVDSPAPPVVALGGTFDHLHAAHKLLLHLALFLATRKLIVGVMSSDQLASKSNAQLVESLEERVRGVEEFLVRCGAVKGREARDDEDAKQDVGDEHRDAGRVVMDVVEINDPLGPTAWDPDIQALVVSRETISGGEFVNRKRREEGLSELELFVIDVISSDLDHGDGSEMVEGVVRDLRDVTSESRLKEVKMGSTAIRQWIKDHEPGMTR
jgi:pantetheine-phosphate adenylyltransferase